MKQILFLLLLLLLLSVIILTVRGRDAQTIADELLHVSGISCLTLGILQPGHWPDINLLVFDTLESPSCLVCQ